MERRKKIFLISVVVVSLVFLAYALPGLAAEKRAKAQEMVITGKVIKGDVDEETKFITLHIKTDNQGEYEVLNKARGRELVNLLDKNVEATGTVKERKGKKYITVTAFKVLE
ncbi:MAG: hypothetical protein PVH82_11680 [Desulfobacteraceae bacterium]|jgi:hypothetical protein